MPTYEFRCPSGHVFERFYQKITEKRRVPCPTCGKQAERQISGGAGVVFKGSGFYATDYPRSEPTKEKAEGESKPAESTPSKKKDSSSSDT